MKEAEYKITESELIEMIIEAVEDNIELVYSEYQGIDNKTAHKEIKKLLDISKRKIEIDPKTYKRLEKQKTKTYIEMHNLLCIIPFKYKHTHDQIKKLRDLLNQEKWLIKEVKK